MQLNQFFRQDPMVFLLAFFDTCHDTVYTFFAVFLKVLFSFHLEEIIYKSFFLERPQGLMQAIIEGSLNWRLHRTSSRISYASLKFVSDILYGCAFEIIFLVDYLTLLDIGSDSLVSPLLFSVTCILCMSFSGYSVRTTTNSIVSFHCIVSITYSVASFKR